MTAAEPVGAQRISARQRHGLVDVATGAIRPLPAVGLGTSRLRGEQARATVEEALRIGYRLIDTAQRYGNEVEIGIAIARSGLPRHAVTVVTKLHLHEMAPERVRPAAMRSLEALGLDRLDFLLLGGFARRVVGLAPRASRNLIGILQDYATEPEHTVRWAWRPGDLAIWDNLATQHYAVYDYGDAHRRAERVTVAGPVPAGVDGRPSRMLRGDASSRIFQA